jgi:hypothetical protein
VAQLIEHLPRKHKALQTPVPKGKKKTKLTVNVKERIYNQQLRATENFKWYFLLL